LLIGDPQASHDISARALLKEFGDVFASLRADDVLRQHEESYVASQET
jgi:hypothetical protein